MVFAEQLVVLRDGRLIQAGRPRDLYLAPADAETAAFLGPAIILDADIRDGLARCSLGAIPLAGRSAHCRAVPAFCCGPSNCSCRRVADPRMAGFWQQSSSLAQPRASQ